MKLIGILATVFVFLTGLHFVYWELVNSNLYDFYRYESGLEYTISEQTPKGKGRVVWLFGGSTAWGAGTPEDQNIATYLSKYGYTVYNYAVPGYTTNQQIFKLVNLLHDGKPDIVIFFDLFNDVVAAYRTKAGNIHAHARRKEELNLSKKPVFYWVKARFRDYEPRIDFKECEMVFEVYQNRMRFVERLAHEFQFEFYSFQQPYREKGLEDLPYYRESMKEFFENSYKPFQNIIDVPENCFTDWCHLTARGNELVAEKIESRL